MTQEEAVILSLWELGGRATLKQLYECAPRHTHFGTKTPDASIRCIIYKSKDIIVDKNEPGWVEHILYKETRIKTLEGELADKNEQIQALMEENERLKKEQEEEKGKSSISTESIISYAKKFPEKKEGAKAIKEMLTYHYLDSNEEANTATIEMLREINKIPEEYDKLHQPHLVIGSADQVVVNNNGDVKYYK